MKKLLCFLLFMAFGSLTMFGQAPVVTGVVSSVEDGSPLPGVTVAAKGTTIGTITDASGNYQINVPEGVEVLIFSFVGLATQEVGIGNMSEVLVNMESDLLEIDEVVVTAMGIRKEKKALGYFNSKFFDCWRWFNYFKFNFFININFGRCGIKGCKNSIKK